MDLLRIILLLAMVLGCLAWSFRTDATEVKEPVKVEKVRPKVWPKHRELCRMWYEYAYNCYVAPNPKYYPTHEA